jgi:predicted DNA-binding transcriptional regulator AlpA
MREKIEKITGTPSEIEKIFGIPRTSLANLRWSRRGPKFFKAGPRRVLYRLADVQAWIESHPVLTKEE